jgi:hypothetical protein
MRITFQGVPVPGGVSCEDVVAGVMSALKVASVLLPFTVRKTGVYVHLLNTWY